MQAHVGDSATDERAAFQPIPNPITDGRRLLQLIAEERYKCMLAEAQLQALSDKAGQRKASMQTRSGGEQVEKKQD